MSFKTKVFSLSLALTLTFTALGQSFAAGTPFTDLKDVSAKDKILSLQAEGYINGVSEGIFAPSQTITAAESVQLIVNAFHLNLDNIRFIKEPKATDSFKNADDHAWYANALIIASVKGFELPADLDPNKEWNKEEFTYYLIKAAEKYGNLPMINLVPVEIKDEDQITVEYSGAIQRALLYKVASLDSEGKFNPKAAITRAEAAEQVYNALEYIKAHPAPTNIPE